MIEWLWGFKEKTVRPKVFGANSLDIAIDLASFLVLCFWLSEKKWKWHVYLYLWYFPFLSFYCESSSILLTIPTTSLIIASKWTSIYFWWEVVAKFGRKKCILSKIVFMLENLFCYTLMYKRNCQCFSKAKF